MYIHIQYTPNSLHPYYIIHTYTFIIKYTPYVHPTYTECTSVVDVAILIDISGDLETTFPVQMATARRLIDGLSFQFSRTRVSYTTFADTPRVHFHLNKYDSKWDVQNAVNINEVEHGKRCY